MAGPPRQNKDLLPYAGFLLAVGGIIYQGGQLSGRVQSISERTDKLELAALRDGTRINEINMRSERSSAKLDFLVQQAAEQNRSHK